MKQHRRLATIVRRVRSLYSINLDDDITVALCDFTFSGALFSWKSAPSRIVQLLADDYID